jgi:cell wall-associated NlpC family hydrolase
MSIKITSVGQLQKGDIILSTTSEPVSKIVKFTTDSKYSHARVYIGNNKIIEAIDPKVKLDNITEVMVGDLYTVVYRYPNLTEMQKLKIVQYATLQINKEYDLSGAIGTSNAGSLPIFAAKIHNMINPEVDLYCSELVAFAYKSAGISLGKLPSQTTPKDLATNKNLEYIGHLKTENKPI